MIYLDTNILIYLFEHHPLYGEKVADQLTAWASNDQVFLSSTLTVTECLAGMNNANIDTLRNVPAMQYANLDEIIAEQAATLQRESKLRIGDAIHLATALHYRASRLFTNDKQLETIAQKYLPVTSFEAA